MKKKILVTFGILSLSLFLQSFDQAMASPKQLSIGESSPKCSLYAVFYVEDYAGEEYRYPVEINAATCKEAGALMDRLVDSLECDGFLVYQY